MPRQLRIEYPGASYHIREVRRLEEAASLQGLRRGLCLGSAEFRERMLELLEPGLGAHHSGEQRLESAVAKGECIMKAELERRGWTPEDLAHRRKSDPEKLAIAARLRKETTLSLKEMAGRARLGAANGANTNWHRWLQRGEPQIVESEITTERQKR